MTMATRCCYLAFLVDMSPQIRSADHRYTPCDPNMLETTVLLPPPHTHTHSGSSSHADSSMAPHVVERLFLRSYREEEEEEDSCEEDECEADPVEDDLYTRRLRQHLHQTSSRRDHDRFLPRFWTPEEEVRVRRILRGSQRRPWYRRMLAGMLVD